MLRRESFFLRAKFSWVDNHVLLYRPKNTTWNIPRRYFNTVKWSRISQLGVIDYNDSGLVNVENTFRNVVNAWDAHAEDLRPLLVQLPHDWCYQIPFAASQDRSKGNDAVLKLKKECLEPTMVNGGELLRLIGPSSHKERLDRLLLTAENGTVSDMTVLIDQPVKQSVCKDGRVNLMFDEYTMTLAIPMSIPALKNEKEKVQPFSRVVAIDQGEIGFAFAVFNLSDAGNAMAEPITTGTVRIPSIRRLIKTVHRYRKSGQQKQKFNQLFDSSMFTLRENVSGDVCGAIVGLMKRFNAFPVLEHQVQNLATGSKQLELVYNMVNHRFTWSSVQAHALERKAWWFASETWDAPNGLLRLYINPTDTKNCIKVGDAWYKTLKLYPGTTVNASMTSRICSHCGRNVFEDIKALENEGVTSVVAKNGEVKLAHGTICLYEKPSKEECKKYLRRNENVPLVSPIRSQELSIKSLKSFVRENLRRAPKSAQTRDTTQSRFFCPYKDCEKHNVEVHADINAAINIGRRLLGDLMVEKTTSNS